MSNSAISLSNQKIWVAGHRGMVGSALVRRLQRENCLILTATRDKLDLRRQSDTESWMAANKPDFIFLAAATVGGIYANDTRSAEFIYDNLMIESNIIHAAWKQGVRKLLFLGSSCIYPKFAKQPILETELLSGYLEPTNQWYAIAKIAGLKLCQAFRKQYGCDFISAMPTNLYGPHDNFHPQYSHVLPALMRKIHMGLKNQSSSIEIWGTGKPRRELLYVDDLADALVYLMKEYSDSEHINIGTGQDKSIKEIAELVSEIIGFKGKFNFNTEMPDGTPNKMLNVEKIKKMGWRPKTNLRQGVQETYAWFLENIVN